MARGALNHLVHKQFLQPHSQPPLLRVFEDDIITTHFLQLWSLHPMGLQGEQERITWVSKGKILEEAIYGYYFAIINILSYSKFSKKCVSTKLYLLIFWLQNTIQIRFQIYLYTLSSVIKKVKSIQLIQNLFHYIPEIILYY